MLGRVLGLAVHGVVVLLDAAGQVFGLPDIESPVGILKDVREEGQSPRVGLEPTT